MGIIKGNLCIERQGQWKLCYYRSGACVDNTHEQDLAAPLWTHTAKVHTECVARVSYASACCWKTLFQSGNTVCLVFWVHIIKVDVAMECIML